MKLIITAAFLVLNFTAHYASADNSPDIVTAGFSKIYVPDGFDDNDHVQILGEGGFPNSCYRYAGTGVEVDHQQMTITLKTTAYKYHGMCLTFVMPFGHEIDLGILKAGKYSILQKSDGKVIGDITINKSITADADDFNYAPITQAFFKSGCITDHVYLTGNFPLSCMKLKEVRNHVQSDVFVLQPIVEIDTSKPCVEGEYPFKTAVNAGFLNKGRYLLHVRSMNGKAINNLIDVPK
jgi:hypothetical protein